MSLSERIPDLLLASACTASGGGAAAADGESASADRCSRPKGTVGYRPVESLPAISITAQSVPDACRTDR